MTALFVLAERQDGVDIVTLNRLDRKIGSPAPLCNALSVHFTGVAESDAIVLVLRESGRRRACLGQSRTTQWEEAAP